MKLKGGNSGICLGAGINCIAQSFVRVVQGGGGGGVSARFTDEKNSESRITDIEISFSRITKISTLLSCSYTTNSV